MYIYNFMDNKITLCFFDESFSVILEKSGIKENKGWNLHKAKTSSNRGKINK